MFAERTGGSEERIDKGCLAMIDMGDKGDVTEWSGFVLGGGHGIPTIWVVYDQGVFSPIGDRGYG
jgi:hypothetical protein